MDALFDGVALRALADGLLEVGPALARAALGMALDEALGELEAGSALHPATTPAAAAALPPMMRRRETMAQLSLGSSRSPRP